MIIRVLNLGQYRFDESHMDDLNACDDAVEAAVANGVKHVAYTSILGSGAPNNPSVEQFDHLAT